MKTKWQMAVVLGAVAVLSSAGLLPPQDLTAKNPQQRSPKRLRLAHDVGAVVEGSKVDHAFVVRNSFEVPIRIADETDIEKNCGCTTLEPSTRRLPSGEVATIRMRVNTAGKNGRFRVSGVVRWRIEGGGIWPVNLQIEGTAKATLSSEPRIVRFSPAEIAANSTKELLIFNAAGVDWSTMNLQISPPYVTTVEKSIHSDHLRLVLRARPPAGVAEFSAKLRLAADLVERQGDSTTCSLTVPLEASQQLGVHISPQVLFSKWSTESNRGTTRFLVHELPSASPESIESISCEGFRTQWAAKNVSSPDTNSRDTLQVELGLSLAGVRADDLTQPRSIQVRLASGETLEVPVYFVGPQDRS